MPKIIIDIKHKILSVARQQLFEYGYSGLALRKLAKDCDIAVGTIYNYFSSKDELVASIMLEDWLDALSYMDKSVENSTSLVEGIVGLEEAIKGFADIYSSIWKQYNDNEGIPKEFAMQQKRLRKQIIEHIDMLLDKFDCKDGKRFSKYMTEIILMCVMHEDTSIDDLKLLVQKIFL